MKPAASGRTLLGGAGGLLAVGGAAEAASAAPAARTGLELRILLIFRKITPVQQDAWLRMGHRVAAGMSPQLAGNRMHRELGAAAHEARDRIDEVLAGVAAGEAGAA